MDIYKKHCEIISKFKLVKAPKQVFYYIPESKLKSMADELDISVEQLKTITTIVGYGQ